MIRKIKFLDITKAGQNRTCLFLFSVKMEMNNKKNFAIGLKTMRT